MTKALTKKELEERVAELEAALEALGETVPILSDPRVSRLEQMLDDFEAKIPDFFYGKGWRSLE